MAPAKSCRLGSRGRGSASSAEASLTADRTQVRRQKLEQRRFAGSVLQSHVLEFKSSKYLSNLAVSAAFETNCGLALAVQNENFESCESFLVSLLCFAFTPDERLDSFFFFT